MNIYDEALNCLNELGQETNDEFEGYIIDCYEDWYYKIIKALERAKKEHELLELYREHKYLVPFMTGLGEKSKRVCDIDKEIKLKEKELEEME